MVTNGKPRPLWEQDTPGLDTAEPACVPTITPYLVETDRPRGAVIVCPGGGYGGRAAHEGAPIAERMNEFGLQGFVCDYRVAPYRHPYPLMDAQRAIRWVRHHAAELNVDPAHVAILGFSAGGHLVSTVGTHFDAGDPQAADPVDRQSSRPDAFIPCYAVITSSGPYCHQGSMRNLLGEDPDPALVESLCNDQQVTPDTPPAFLWHTASDNGVPVQNSLLFATALCANGVACELHVYPTGNHGLGLALGDPHVATWSQLCGEWLLGMGF
jgi:acetyl esterase/lipase